MRLVKTFNLEAELARAEAGDAAAWEGIARHLLASKPAAKRPRKAKGGRPTWAHITLADGREFLTSHYHVGTDEATLAAHAAYAQFRGRMEDSGERSDYGLTGVSERDRPLKASFQFEKRAFLNPAIKPVPVKATRFVEGEEVESVRDHCFRQRGFRQGWIKDYIAQEAQAA